MGTGATAAQRFRESLMDGGQCVASSSFVGVRVAHQQRKTACDAGFHRGSIRAAVALRPARLLGFGACLGCYPLAHPRMDEEVQGSGYCGERTNPPRRVSTDGLGLQPYDRFVLYHLLHPGPPFVLVPPGRFQYEHEPSGGTAHHSIAVFLARFCPRGGCAPGASGWFATLEAGI